MNGRPWCGREARPQVPTSAVFGTQAGRKLFIDGPGATTKYSLATPGAPLGRHVDQYHEAFNKARGAYVDLHGERTRRSLAWLLYLGDEDWDRPGSRGSGGTLHAYPRADAAGRCGQHEGNLQVGWLERGCGSEAVFLDSWIAPPEMEGHRSVAELRRAWEREGRYASAEELGTALVEVQPSYGLYCLVDGVRVDLSAPHRRPCTGAGGAWLERARKWSGEQVPSLNEMLPEELRPSFSSMTATDPREQRRLVAVPPRGGTLVIFESNVVPHEVNPVLTGQRVYVGGFFAEERHVPPAWVDSAEARGPRWACAAGWARTDDA